MIKQIQLRGISRTPSDDVIWKDIPGFQGKYSVNNLGEVRSNIAYGGRGKLLGQHIRNGYYELNMYDCNNNRNSHRVHRLVVEAFIGPIPDGMQVNHINGNKRDNRFENLEIVSQSENALHAYRIGLSSPSDNGLKKHVSVLKDGKIMASYKSIREMSREMNLDRRSVQRTLDGTVKQYKGYTFAL